MCTPYIEVSQCVPHVSDIPVCVRTLHPVFDDQCSLSWCLHKEQVLCVSNIVIFSLCRSCLGIKLTSVQCRFISFFSKMVVFFFCSNQLQLNPS